MLVLKTNPRLIDSGLKHYVAINTIKAKSSGAEEGCFFFRSFFVGSD